MIKKLFGLVAFLAVVAGAIYAVVVLTADDDLQIDEQVIVVDDVGRKTLQDLVILRGTVNRDERFTLFSAGQGRVTALALDEESVIEPGDIVMEVDGRPMYAIEGSIPYWRPLSRTSPDGPDVELLEQQLVHDGFDPGTVDQDFTAATRTALRDWQEAKGYPDDGVFLPTDLAVGQWPATVGTVELEVGQFVTPGLPLVILVEDELSVIVSVDPTDRSRLEPGLRTTVEVPATGENAPGRILELADTANIDGQGGQRYRGEVELLGELVAVAGTAVRMEVVLEEVIDALVVPVASVSLSADGVEQVRILTRAGTITRVPVTTGLT
ncbi:MAG: HlyD family efflux transporter periplasmic adaptor subunit, partial [Actinomycetota bacterium]|nr:HlyD family efflux transporter periplasmic adaptor subunit [Actinomycetota bacterium]